MYIDQEKARVVSLLNVDWFCTWMLMIGFEEHTWEQDKVVTMVVP